MTEDQRNSADNNAKRRKADIKTAEREARLAKALRENLRRRKAQLKGKADLAAEQAGVTKD